MGREHPDFREHIAQIDGIYPGRLMLTTGEAMGLTGIKSKTTFAKYFGKYTQNGGRQISRVYVAKYLCGMRLG